MTRKGSLFLALIVIVCLSLFFFLYLSKKKPVKIGFIANLSGRSSQLGVSARNGASMAIDEINNGGGINGHPVQLVIKDSHGEKDRCSSATKELLNEGVAAIIGPYVSSMAKPVMDVAEPARKLVISPTVSTDILSGIDDYFLRINASASAHGQKLAEAALARGDSEFAIVMDRNNREYTEAVAKGFIAGVKYPGISVKTELYFSNKSEFKPLAEQLSQLKVDGVLFAASGIDAAGIIQQYAKFIDIPNIYGSTWTKATKIHEYGGKTVEGMMLVAAYENREPTENEKIFNQQYKDRYGTDPNFAAIYSYEAILLLKRAATETQSFQSDVLKNAILNMKTISGVRDKYHLNGYGDAIRDQSIFIIKDGTYVLAEAP